MHAMASAFTFRIPPFLGINSEIKSRLQVRVESLGSGDSVIVDGTFSVNEKEQNGEIFKNGALVDRGNGRLKPFSVERKWKKKSVSEELELLWDDGYRTKTVKDYLEEAKEMVRPDAGPPRWFCPVECGQPLQDSPVLLFLPGLDGVGLGLILHHKALGKAFEVWCLHIPVYNRTPFQELVKFVEQAVRLEHASSPNKPIYLVGDSFGGCLALAVAARNPKIDLEVILVNPATSFGRSQLQPLLPVLESFPNELHNTIPYLLSFVMGNPMKMAMVDLENKLPPRIKMEQLSAKLTGLLPGLSTLADLIPKETLLWKLKLLKCAANYANSRLHAVKAPVLVVASGNDNMLPSGDEARRLREILPDCVVRYFKDNGHTLLMEDGISLLTIIKGTSKYRRSRTTDYVSDFLPPSMSEFNRATETIGLTLLASSAATYSTLDDGKIVRGLAGIPSEGPVILVGYHNLLGLELFPLFEEMLREKKILVRGIAHPELFRGQMENSATEFSVYDWMKVMGAVPVKPSNMFKLLAAKEYVLLYPGGAREALHFKGEEYKLFWPEQAEFVRMAARFGATIVPFGAVGEDDLLQLVLDYHDLMKIPVVSDRIREATRKAVKIRDESQGEVANQELFLPGLLPKLPGRFYFLFGKPIQTKGRQEFLKDRENANQLYRHIKSDVESCLAYLLKKREEDPFRNLVDRAAYCALNYPVQEIPSFPP